MAPMGPSWEWANMFDVMLHVGIFTLVDCLPSFLPSFHLSITILWLSYLSVSLSHCRSAHKPSWFRIWRGGMMLRLPWNPNPNETMCNKEEVLNYQNRNFIICKAGFENAPWVCRLATFSSPLNPESWDSFWRREYEGNWETLACFCQQETWVWIASTSRCFDAMKSGGKKRVRTPVKVTLEVPSNDSHQHYSFLF